MNNFCVAIPVVFGLYCVAWIRFKPTGFFLIYRLTSSFLSEVKS